MPPWGFRGVYGCLGGISRGLRKFQVVFRGISGDFSGVSLGLREIRDVFRGISRGVSEISGFLVTLIRVLQKTSGSFSRRISGCLRVALNSF